MIKEFHLRTHHIRTLIQFIESGLTAQEFVKQRDLPHYRTLRWICDRPDINGMTMGEYARDIIGVTKEDERKYVRRTSRALKQFQDMPDTTPVVLSDAEDGICRATVGGRHCKFHRADPLNDDWTLAAKMAHQLGPENCSVTVPSPFKRIVRTTAGPFRQALKDYKQMLNSG